MIIYDTEVTLNEKKYIYFSFFLFLIMICVTLAFEDHCAGERAAAAVTGNLYVPPTRAQYLSLIDRPAHQAYLFLLLLVLTSLSNHSLMRTLK